MNTDVENQKSGVSVTQILLIALAVAGAASLAAYQFFFCAGCYA